MYYLQILLSLEVALALGLFIAWLVLRIKKKKFAAIIVLLVLSFEIVMLLEALMEWNREFSYYFYWPLTFLHYLIPTVTAILLAFRLFTSYIFKGIDSEKLPNYSNPEVLSTTISKILDSEHFLTALRSTLPRGEDDKQLGFDYIPFMLESIDQRRKRAAKSARFFLIATTLSALFFSCVVMYFGYILVNESSAGMARSLADIKTSVESMTEDLRVTLQSYYSNVRFQQDVVPSLEKLGTLEPGEKNKQVQDRIINSIREAKRIGDFTPLSTVLAQAEMEASREGDKEKTYSLAVTDAFNNMTKFRNAQSISISDLASRIEELKSLTQKVEEALSKPENRVPEIIKRLALGLVIATFFLALLRYMGSLYGTRYQQVLAAENDDFMIRRFYVAFKSSVPSDEQRKAVLSSFMTAPNSMNGATSRQSLGDTTKQGYEIFKELLGALSKKL